MFQRAFFVAACLLAAATANGQVTVTQQPGAIVTVKQATAPLMWQAIGPAGELLFAPGTPEWKQFLSNGRWTVVAIGADGKFTQQPIQVPNGSPGPGPGPTPDPIPNPLPPDPTPNPTPTPGEITAAIVFDPAGMKAETASQAAMRMNLDLPKYMAGKEYKWRVFNGPPQNEKGEAAEAFFTVNAAKLGKYPALVIGKPGSAIVHYAGQANNWTEALSTLQKFGGLPTQADVQRAGIWAADHTPDAQKLGVDLPAPANVSMGLIPARKGAQKLKFATPADLGIPDIPESAWYDWYTQMPPTIVSQFVWQVKDQDGLGACAAFAASGAVQAAEYAAGLPQKELASFALYSLVAYPRDAGSGLDENAQTVQDVGIPEVAFSPKFAGKGGWSNSSTWPAGWKENAARHKCTVMDLGGASASEGFHNLVVMLLHGIPCTIGVDWPGGHSILAVAPVFEAKKCTGVLIVNSWGADWNGDGRTIRSRSNVTNGIATFGGPFAFICPTFPKAIAKPVPEKSAAPAASCPGGVCPAVRYYSYKQPTLEDLRQSFGATPFAAL